MRSIGKMRFNPEDFHSAVEVNRIDGPLPALQRLAFCDIVAEKANVLLDKWVKEFFQDKPVHSVYKDENGKWHRQVVVEDLTFDGALK